MTTLAWVALTCAAVPALLYLWNSFLFREPPEIGEQPRASGPSPGRTAMRQRAESWANGHASAGRVSSLPEAPDSAGLRQAVRQDTAGVNPSVRLAISVLIPARNEEHGIAECVESVLESSHVELEVIVLDDHSTDRTADIVREIAAKDARLRLETAPPLPDGWCGKQAACFALSRLAKYDVLTFLDADVRLEPDALARMILFQEQSGAALVSGFPHQETVTFLEKLLIPLIHWLLLSFLPLWAMRRFRWSAFGAGCGQWFLTTRAAYERVGGHAAIKSSLHDGLTLPRAYRRAGFMTDVCDAINLATCRMYRTNRAVWFGLAKNAREGMAGTKQIGFWTAVLLLGQVLPWPFMFLQPWNLAVIYAVALLMSTTARTSLAHRMSEQGSNRALLHPLAILLLLAIQWYALARAVLGKPVAWKGRTHSHLPGEPATDVAGSPGPAPPL